MSGTIQDQSTLGVKIEEPEARIESIEQVKVVKEEHKEKIDQEVEQGHAHEKIAPTEVANLQENEQNKIEAIEKRQEQSKVNEQTNENKEKIIQAKDIENVQQQQVRSKQSIYDPKLLAQTEIKEPVNHLDSHHNQKKQQEHVQVQKKEELSQKEEQVQRKEEEIQNEVLPQQEAIFQQEIKNDAVADDLQVVVESRTQHIEEKEEIVKGDQKKQTEIAEYTIKNEPEPIIVHKQNEKEQITPQQKQNEKINQEEHEQMVQTHQETEEKIVMQQQHPLQDKFVQQNNSIHHEEIKESQTEKEESKEDTSKQPQIEALPQHEINPIQPEIVNNMDETKVQQLQAQSQQINQTKPDDIKNKEQVEIKRQQTNEAQLNEAIVEKESLQEQQIIKSKKEQGIVEKQANNESKEPIQEHITEKEPQVLKMQTEDKPVNESQHIQQVKVLEKDSQQLQQAHSPEIETQTGKIQLNVQEMEERYEEKAQPIPYEVRINDSQENAEKVQEPQPHHQIIVQQATKIENNIDQNPKPTSEEHIENVKEKQQSHSTYKEEQKPVQLDNIVEENEHTIQPNITSEKMEKQLQSQKEQAKEQFVVQELAPQPQIAINQVNQEENHEIAQILIKQQHSKQQASQNKSVSKEVEISEAKAQFQYQGEASNKQTSNFKVEESQESNVNQPQIAQPIQPIVQKEEIVAQVVLQQEHKIESYERVNEQEKPISQPSRQPQNPSIHSNKQFQYEQKQQINMQAHKIQEQQLQKQRYRINTQIIDSHQQKIKEQKVVEFVEFTPQQKIQVQQEIKKEIHVIPVDNNAKNIQEDTNKQLNYTFLPPIQTKKTIQKPHRTIDILKEQISNKKAESKENVGKISRKNLIEKNVHEVIADLKKYDEQKPAKVQHERKFSSRKRKSDSAKHDNIGIKSNIINVTIGELLSKDESVEAGKLLGQIDQLKKKLYELEKKKEMAMNSIESPNMDNESIQRDTIVSNKSNKKITGRIYRRADSSHSRVTEQIQTQGYMTEKSSVGFMNPSISSAPRQRLSSTQDFPISKTASKQPELENKTGPIIFRVKKNNKTIHAPFDFNIGQKEAGFIKSREFEDDKNFQTRREDRQNATFQQEKLKLIQKPAPRKLIFQEDFKKETDKYFIQLGNELPKRDWNQQQLTQTAKETFKKFGVSIANEKKLILCVKKYKNCVSFILDSARTILWYYEGKFYFGGWKINSSGQGQKNGWGYDYSPGKYVYSGSFFENKRDGHGVMKFLTRENDVIYEGEWKNGFKHGIGKQRDIDGSEYIGSWVQGKKNGQGRIKISEEEGYVGNFLNGVKNGQGIEKFKNGDSYEGSYYDGKFHGMGVYIWGNLSRYEGQFKQGSRNGNGIWISNYNDENSDRYQGQYRNDRKNGFGVYKWKDGTVYEGQFLNDLKHGQGIVSYGDGKSTKLQWFQGNVVPRQNAEKQRSGIKRPISKSGSKKGQQKHTERNAPLIKFHGNQAKLKPTRISLGMEQF